MRRNSITRSIGFRLSVAFAAIVVIAAITAGAVSYSIIREQLRLRHAQAVSEVYDLLADAYAKGGLGELVESIDAHAKVDQDRDSVFLLSAADGRRIAGNITLPRPLAGSGPVPAARLGIRADYPYVIRQGAVGDHRLLVGSSAEDIGELSAIVLKGSAWAALVLAAIVIAGGVALSRHLQRRIDRVNAAMEQIAGGALGVRVPLGGRGDDIDVLGGIINDTVARLATTVDSIRQISNDISHDLKTPLNRLRITLEAAQHKLNRGDPAAADLAEALEEADGIINTFDALLRIAQLESGARRSRFTAVDLAAVMADVGEFYRALAEDSGMVLEAHTAAVPPVVGDKHLLTQMLANLIENAMRHCPRGSRIRCSVTGDDSAVIATVADDGPGIPAAERGNVLRRLYRLEQSRTTPGSGLGLSMVKAIADLHDAELTLGDNAPGLIVTLRFAPRRAERP